MPFWWLVVLVLAAWRRGIGNARQIADACSPTSTSAIAETRFGSQGFHLGERAQYLCLDAVQEQAGSKGDKVQGWSCCVGARNQVWYPGSANVTASRIATQHHMTTGGHNASDQQ